MNAELRFVIHEHHASTHHFDLRLEKAGVLWSWAVPKGMPTDPSKNRLAVRVEDHDLDHIDFEDLSPVPDMSEAVRKSIWDRGVYEVVKFSPTKLVVDLHGQRLDALRAIFETGGSNWVIHRMS